MWNIIWVSPQGHRSVSVSRHFLLQAPQCPCSVQKRFSRRPLLPREVETRLPDCGVTHQVRIDHLSQLPVMPPSTFDVNWLQVQPQHSGFLDVSRSNGGLRISGWTGQLSCLTIFAILVTVHRRNSSYFQLGNIALHQLSASDVVINVSLQA